MSNLDDSIGKILWDLQKNDPESFKKLMQKALKENPELLESTIEDENKEIEEYSRQVEQCNKEIDED